DLRGFTRLAEHKLPYDVVFFLNRYFEAVGRAIAAAGGIANQYTGDGVIALFGVESGPQPAGRQALPAPGATIPPGAQPARRLPLGGGAGGAAPPGRRPQHWPRRGGRDGLRRDALPHRGR